MQRFREGFSAIAPMRTLGELWDRDVAGAAREAARIGRTIASELRAHGVDFSFTPVLDVDHGQCAVIGDRALHRNPNAIAHLAAALCDGLRSGGMAAVGKHFPGHGHVAADSHTELPVDDRPLAAIVAADLVPFGALVHRGLEAIMPAHVVYPAVDGNPAGYSRKWLQEILRGRLGLRRPHLFRRPRHGGRAGCRRPCRPGGGVRGGRVRHGARLQRFRGCRRAPRDVESCTRTGSRAARREDAKRALRRSG